MTSAPAGDLSSEATARPGALLKTFRTRKGWTLAEVSGRTGLPVSTLSKLENEKISFSYDKLMQISRGLKLDIAELLSPEASDAPPLRVIGRRSVSRAGDGVTVDSGSYVYQHLGTDLLDKAFVPMVGEIRARSLEEFGDMIQHPGEEFVYVLKGKLELHTSIYAPVVLEEGDSIYFDSDMGHAYIAAGPGPCIVLSICSGSRDRG
jgi:transcriptional regulator with XRE-family HTH domain